MFSTLLPPDGTKTVWEDRCILVHVDNAKDVSGSPKLLPSVLLADDLPPELLLQRAAVYPPDMSADGCEEGGHSDSSSGSGASRGTLLERLTSHLQAAVAPLALSSPLTLVWSRFLSGCQPRATAPPLEWHPRLPLLAAADPRGRVQLVDMAPCLRPGANGASRPELLAVGPSGGGAGGGCLRAVLAHEALHHQALSLSWSPTAPGLLAVGSAGAVGLWAVAGEARPPLAAAGRSSGPWLRLLRTRVAGARVTSLSWSPDGRLLAAASPNQAGLQVWDVASGNSTPVGAGPAAFDMVRWSPCGNYVFASGTGSHHFYIFETQRWRWARWQTGSSSSTPSGHQALHAGAAGGASGEARTAAAAGPASVVAAAWAPPAPGRNPVLLAALYGQSYLVAAHLVDSPPGLTAQLLPVALPELQRGAVRGGAPGARTEGGEAGSSSAATAAAVVADMAWDPRGERLAVMLAPSRGKEAHYVALYGTITDPLVSARLIGLARPPQHLCRAAAASGGPPTPLSAAEAAGGGVAATSAPGQDRSAGDPSSSQGATGGVLAAASRSAGSLETRPGGLVVARLAPLGGGAVGPSCVISARVGVHGIYNLPCFL